MEDDSPVIYGLELNVSGQFIGLPFVLQMNFDNDFKGSSSLQNLINTKIVKNSMKSWYFSW